MFIDVILQIFVAIFKNLIGFDQIDYAESQYIIFKNFEKCLKIGNVG